MSVTERCILINNILNKEMNKGILLKMRASIYILNDRLIVRISNTGHMSLSFQNVNNFRIVYRIIIFKFKKCMVINLLLILKMSFVSTCVHYRHQHKLYSCASNSVFYKCKSTLDYCLYK